MTVCVIDYGAGNLHSAAKAFAHEAAPLGLAVQITTDAAALANASHIVLPGVGAFADCMAGLKAASGMIAAMEKAVHGRGVPFFGICVGMQMLASKGLEHGTHEGLGWIDGDVVPIAPSRSGPSQEEPSETPLPETISPPSEPLRIPHMGWNELTLIQSEHPVFEGFGIHEHAYFVHSYHFMCRQSAHQLATTDYGTALSACIGCGTVLGTQFHPEKSQRVGLKMIGNFLKMGRA